MQRWQSLQVEKQRERAIMIVFVNEVTADSASIHHPSQSLDNDASLLDLQPYSASCWQMAPPIREHSETPREEQSSCRDLLTVPCI